MKTRWTIAMIVAAPLLLHLRPAAAQGIRAKGVDPCHVDEG